MYDNRAELYPGKMLFTLDRTGIVKMCLRLPENAELADYHLIL